MKGQSLAAAALIAANVTPVVTIHIPFGGDNHSDQNLQGEADQTVSGVAAIQTLMGNLSSLGLQDKVTFATWNVFGRNLNGIAKVTSRTGRDHYGNHAVTVMIGKNVAPSVIGGVAPDASGAYVASPIDSGSGNVSASGDIASAATHDAAARTLAGALGIPASATAAGFIASAGGKVGGGSVDDGALARRDGSWIGEFYCAVPLCTWAMRHTLEREQLVSRPRSEVFAFFADASNLGRLTPRSLGFKDPDAFAHRDARGDAHRLPDCALRLSVSLAYAHRSVRARGALRRSAAHRSLPLLAPHPRVRGRPGRHARQ